MRLMVVGVVGAAVLLSAAPALATWPVEDPAAPEPVAEAAPAVPSVDEVLEAVTPYSSRWGSIEESVAAMDSFIAELTLVQERYRGWRDVLQPELDELNAGIAELEGRAQNLQTEINSTTESLGRARAQQAAQEKRVGNLARLLYQQPAPEMAAIEQLMEGENLRAFEGQNLVTSVLTSDLAELQRIVAAVAVLEQLLAEKQAELAQVSEELAAKVARRDTVAQARRTVEEALQVLAGDIDKAADRSAAIRAAEEEALRRAAEEAARAAAEVSGGGASVPVVGGAPAAPTGGFSAALPADIPYRDVFITYGVQYNVEPALLAAIARQESGFDPWAGCFRTGGGKGIMQHENQSQYCGRDAVPASVAKAAGMLASYYNRSGSWTAAVFAYNNGPGLMDEWVAYSADPATLLGVLAAHYDRQPYASAGPYRGYPSWGAWRARVAYSYAAPVPIPGFHSATEKWLLYRQG